MRHSAVYSGGKRYCVGKRHIWGERIKTLGKKCTKSTGRPPNTVVGEGRKEKTGKAHRFLAGRRGKPPRKRKGGKTFICAPTWLTIIEEKNTTPREWDWGYRSTSYLRERKKKKMTESLQSRPKRPGIVVPRSRK